VNHRLGNRLFFLIGCVEECRLKESVEWANGHSHEGRLMLASGSELRRRPKSDHRIFGRDYKSFISESLEVSVLLLSQAGACFC